MQTESVATPFGQRSVTLALIKKQMNVPEISPGKVADKWKVFRDVAAAKVGLGLQSSSLALLDALLSFYPDNELRQDRSLIVFPSNVQLALRAHQMADATIRRHLAALVEAGLIIRRDSANGKRYARKNRSGGIETAFGFDLSPLLARAEEFRRMAEEVIVQREMFRQAKSDLTICRRNIRKLLTAAIEEGAEGNWGEMENVYLRIVQGMSRSTNIDEIAVALNALRVLEADVVKCLDQLDFTENPDGNARQDEQHIQNSKPDYHTELELGFETKPKQKPRLEIATGETQTKAFPLGMILRACPTILDYNRGQPISSWRDFMTAAVVVRSMLGVSSSAYEAACDVMGPENAAAAIAGILERSNFISSPGGYLRDLTQRAERGEFSLGPMIMALLRANGGSEARRTG